MRLLTVLLFLFAECAFAQTSTLRGTVTDESGAVIPSARVALTSPGEP